MKWKDGHASARASRLGVQHILVRFLRQPVLLPDLQELMRCVSRPTFRGLDRVKTTHCIALLRNVFGSIERSGREWKSIPIQRCTGAADGGFVTNG